MANKIGRIIIGIVIVVAVFVIIWLVLPGQYKNPLLATYQSKTNDNYEKVVDPIKNALVMNNKDYTYDNMMVTSTANPSWTIEERSVQDNGDGSYFVYANGYKCTVSVESEDNDDSMITHTNAHVLLVFEVTKNGDEIKLGNKVVEPDKQILPDRIEVDTTKYNKTDKSNYFQLTLDALCGK